LRENIKIILIAYLLSLILWAITIAVTHINFLVPEDFLGTSCRLPIIFWLALVLVILGLMKAYLTNNQILLYSGLILLILILFLTYPLIEPAGRHGVSYTVSGVSKQIVDGTYFSDSYKIDWNGFPYLAYQGFPLYVTIFVEQTGLPVLAFIKFSPVFMVLIVVLIISAFYRNIFKN